MATAIAALLVLASVDTTASAEGAWLLWSKVYIMKDREITDYFFSVEAFASKPECEKAASQHKENYKSDGTREADFKCLCATPFKYGQNCIRTGL